MVTVNSVTPNVKRCAPNAITCKTFDALANKCTVCVTGYTMIVDNNTETCLENSTF